MDESWLLRTVEPCCFPLMWDWGLVSCCGANIAARTSQSVGMSWKQIQIYLFVSMPLTEEEASSLVEGSQGKEGLFSASYFSLLRSLLRLPQNYSILEPTSLHYLLLMNASDCTGKPSALF